MQPPDVRKCEIDVEAGPLNWRTMKRFGMTINPAMTTAPAHILLNPRLVAATAGNGTSTATVSRTYAPGSPSDHVDAVQIVDALRHPGVRFAEAVR